MSNSKQHRLSNINRPGNAVQNPNSYMHIDYSNPLASRMNFRSIARSPNYGIHSSLTPSLNRINIRNLNTQTRRIFEESNGNADVYNKQKQIEDEAEAERQRRLVTNLKHKRILSVLSINSGLNSPFVVQENVPTLIQLSLESSNMYLSLLPTLSEINPASEIINILDGTNSLIEKIQLRNATILSKNIQFLWKPSVNVAPPVKFYINNAADPSMNELFELNIPPIELVEENIKRLEVTTLDFRWIPNNDYTQNKIVLRGIRGGDVDTPPSPVQFSSDNLANHIQYFPYGKSKLTVENIQGLSIKRNQANIHEISFDTTIAPNNDSEVDIIEICVENTKVARNIHISYPGHPKAYILEYDPPHLSKNSFHYEPRQFQSHGYVPSSIDSRAFLSNTKYQAIIQFENSKTKEPLYPSGKSFENMIRDTSIIQSSSLPSGTTISNPQIFPPKEITHVHISPNFFDTRRGGVFVTHEKSREYNANIHVYKGNVLQINIKKSIPAGNGGIYIKNANTMGTSDQVVGPTNQGANLANTSIVWDTKNVTPGTYYMKGDKLSYISGKIFVEERPVTTGVLFDFDTTTSSNPNFSDVVLNVNGMFEQLYSSASTKDKRIYPFVMNSCSEPTKSCIVSPAELFHDISLDTFQVKNKHFDKPIPNITQEAIIQDISVQLIKVTGDKSITPKIHYVDYVKYYRTNGRSNSYDIFINVSYEAKHVVKIDSSSNVVGFHYSKLGPRVGKNTMNSTQIHTWDTSQDMKLTFGNMRIGVHKNDVYYGETIIHSELQTPTPVPYIIFPANSARCVAWSANPSHYNSISAINPYLNHNDKFPNQINALAIDFTINNSVFTTHSRMNTRLNITPNTMASIDVAYKCANDNRIYFVENGKYYEEFSTTYENSSKPYYRIHNNCLWVFFKKMLNIEYISISKFVTSDASASRFNYDPVYVTSSILKPNRFLFTKTTKQTDSTLGFTGGALEVLKPTNMISVIPVYDFWKNRDELVHVDVSLNPSGNFNFYPALSNGFHHGAHINFRLHENIGNHGFAIKFHDSSNVIIQKKQVRIGGDSLVWNTKMCHIQYTDETYHYSAANDYSQKKGTFTIYPSVYTFPFVDRVNHRSDITNDRDQSISTPADIKNLKTYQTNLSGTFRFNYYPRGTQHGFVDISNDNLSTITKNNNPDYNFEKWNHFSSHQSNEYKDEITFTFNSALNTEIQRVAPDGKSTTDAVLVVKKYSLNNSLNLSTDVSAFWCDWCPKGWKYHEFYGTDFVPDLPVEYQGLYPTEYVSRTDAIAKKWKDIYSKNYTIDGYDFSLIPQGFYNEVGDTNGKAVTPYSIDGHFIRPFLRDVMDVHGTYGSETDFQTYSNTQKRSAKSWENGFCGQSYGYSSWVRIFARQPRDSHDGSIGSLQLGYWGVWGYCRPDVNYRVNSSGDCKPSGCTGYATDHGTEKRSGFEGAVIENQKWQGQVNGNRGLPMLLSGGGSSRGATYGNFPSGKMHTGWDGPMDNRLHGYILFSNRVIDMVHSLHFDRNQDMHETEDGIYLAWGWIALPLMGGNVRTSDDDKLPTNSTGDFTWTYCINTEEYSGPFWGYAPEFWWHRPETGAHIGNSSRGWNYKNHPFYINPYRTMAYRGVDIGSSIGGEYKPQTDAFGSGFTTSQPDEYMKVPQWVFPNKNKKEGFCHDARDYDRDTYNKFVPLFHYDYVNRKWVNPPNEDDFRLFDTRFVRSPGLVRIPGRPGMIKQALLACRDPIKKTVGTHYTRGTLTDPATGNSYHNHRWNTLRIIDGVDTSMSLALIANNSIINVDSNSVPVGETKSARNLAETTSIYFNYKTTSVPQSRYHRTASYSLNGTNELAWDENARDNSTRLDISATIQVPESSIPPQAAFLKKCEYARQLTGPLAFLKKELDRYAPNWWADKISMEGKKIYQTVFDDGGVYSYYWCKFIDQPTMIVLRDQHPLKYTNEYLEGLQKRVEYMHKYFANRDFINVPPPVSNPSGKFHKIKIDPAQVVTPPPGMEYGYVPVQISKEYYDKLHLASYNPYSNPISSLSYQPYIQRFTNRGTQEMWY